MASTKLYFDKRAAKSDSTCPVKIAFTKKSITALFSLGISVKPEQWDAGSSKIVRHPDRVYLNSVLTRRMAEAGRLIVELIDSGEYASMSAKQIKDRFARSFIPEEERTDTFEKRFMAFMESKEGGTRSVYRQTLNRLRAFCPDLASLKFEEINFDWLTRFDRFLAETAPSRNARNIHFRNIRAVFNAAIDDEIISCYPFRKFKIRPVKTRKRSLPINELRQLFEYPVEEYAVIYRDMFKLIFMLCGINAVDLFNLKDLTHDGRIEYSRAKTHRLYSIKVEPEALEIINRYRGKSGLLSIADRWTDHRNFLHQINKALQRIGAEKNQGGRLPGGDPKKNLEPVKGLWPELSTYWARHSWATVAASLDIPKETIAAALGHGGDTVTDIYIDFDQRKVDEANRRVIDWVLYGKK